MKISNVELSISAVRQSQYPVSSLPEFLIVGRSNVGKSSFVNTLINRNNYARTSSKPGKTQTLNFYKINDDFYFVDDSQITKLCIQDFTSAIAYMSILVEKI